MAQYLNQSLYPAEFDLHKKYAPTELQLDLIWTHSNVIADVVVDLLDSKHFDATPFNRGRAIKAGLLIDIGAYCCSGFEWIPGQPLMEYPYVQHTVLGAQILSQEGYADEIVRAALVHTGVGLTAQDITDHMLQLPPGDYMPATDFEWLLTYAAKFHSKTPSFKTVEEVEASLAKYSQEKVDLFKQLQQTFGIPKLDKIQAKYAEWHTNFQFRVSQLVNGSVGNSVIAVPSVDFNSAGIATTAASTGEVVGTGLDTATSLITDTSSVTTESVVEITLPPSSTQATTPSA
jgi:uncharacterized protein